MIQVKIPKGWRKLSAGERIKRGDRFHWVGAVWAETEMPGLKIGGPGVSGVYIRKIKRQEKPRRQKRQKRWVNLYPDCRWDSATTKQVADLCASSRIAVVKVMM